jgi:adenylate cyclase
MAQLIDATAGSHIWGERYDGEVADIFDLQDRVTEAVVGAIEPTIALSEIERIKRKRPENLDAYECAMRALPAVWAQDPETTSEGLRLAQRAMVLDPAYALPKALAAWCHAQRIAYMRTTDLAEDRARAVELAREAVRLESNDPLVLTLAGAAYTLVREYRTAGLLLQKALTLDPNSAWGWARSGWLHVYLQQPDVAIQHFNRAMRLSPLDPMNFNVLFGIGGAHNVKRERMRRRSRGLREGLNRSPMRVGDIGPWRPLMRTQAGSRRPNAPSQSCAKLIRGSQFQQSSPTRRLRESTAAVFPRGSAKPASRNDHSSPRSDPCR